MISFYKKYRIEILLFVVALFVRLVLFSVNFDHNNHSLIPTIHGDDGYYEISQGILAGHGFTGDIVGPYDPNPLRPPLWPFLIAFLAKVFGSYWAVFAFEIIIGSLIPVFGYRIAQLLFGIKKISFWTGILMAIEPYSVLLSSLLYSETIFTFLFLIFVYFLIKYFENYSLRNLVWFSVFLGLATMAKLTIQYIPLVLIVIIAITNLRLFGNIRWKQLLVMLGIFLSLIIPWVIRNYVEFGKVGLSAQPAFNLYVYLVPTVLSIDNGTSFAIEHKNFVRKDNFDENSINLSNASLYKDEAMNILKDHKLALAKSVAGTFVTFFTHDGLLTVFQNAGIIISNSANRPAISMLFSDPGSLFVFIKIQMKSWGILILVARLLWIAISLSFFVGIAKLLIGKRLNISLITSLLLVFYFTFTTAINGLGVNARFKVPVLVFVFSFALYGLFSLKEDNISTEPN